MYFEPLPGAPIHRLASDETKAKNAEFEKLNSLMEEEESKWTSSHEKLKNTDDEMAVFKSRTEWRKVNKKKSELISSFRAWLAGHCFPEYSRLSREENSRLPQVEEAVVDKLVSIGFRRSTEGRGAYPRSAVIQHPCIRDQRDLIDEIDGYRDCIQEAIRLCDAAIGRIETRLEDMRKKSMALL